MERNSWVRNPEPSHENYLSNVSVFVSEDFGNRCEVDLLKKTLRFVDNISNVLGNQFNNSLMHEYRKKINNPNPLSLRVIKKTGLNLPQFRIFDSPSAKDYLAEWDCDPIENGKLMIAFLMPPQIARFNLYKYENGPNYESSINWENVSYKVNKLMRKCANEAINNGTSLELSQINNIIKHDANRFHYLYEVSQMSSNYFTKGK